MKKIRGFISKILIMIAWFFGMIATLFTILSMMVNGHKLKNITAGIGNLSKALDKMQ